MALHTVAPSWPQRIFAARTWRRSQRAVCDHGPRLRRIAAGDRFALVALLLGLSARSCRLRYSRTQFTRAEAAVEAERLLNNERAGGVVIVAVVAAEGGEQIVGVGELGRSGVVGELAVLVADAHQCRGIGKTLVAALQSAAESAGIARIRIDTLEENDVMCALARRIGLSLSEWHEHGEVHFTAWLW